MMDFKKNWRIVLLGVCLVLSLLIISVAGLRFGIDFIGGTEMKMELRENEELYIGDTARILNNVFEEELVEAEAEATEDSVVVTFSGDASRIRKFMEDQLAFENEREVYYELVGEGSPMTLRLNGIGKNNVALVANILKKRLNKLGLKSVQVLPEVDGKHITLKVSSTDPEELEEIRNILKQQATFEQLVEGDLCARGDEIQLDLAAVGGAVIVQNGRWEVRVRTTGEAPKRCGLAMEGKSGRMTDLFIDRPQDTIILAHEDLCDELKSDEFKNNAEDIGYTMFDFIEKRALMPVLCYSGDTLASSLMEELGIVFENQTNGTQDPVYDYLERLRGNKTRVIIAAREDEVPEELLYKVEELNYEVSYYPRYENQPLHEREESDISWIDNVTGLKSTLSIQEGLTYGSPIFNSVFTGGAETKAEAEEIVKKYEIWLTSGNLPVKVDIVLEKPNLPELGQRFLSMSMIVAVVALLIVSLVIFFRYREPRISGSIIFISISEITLILGFAALVGWELDLAAIAGIIAAVGTGVDAQVVITDETLRGERKKKEEKGIWDVHSAISRAFFIIFTSAATTIAAMLPLMSIVDLKGFAFTIIVGVLIGVFITRPAYARIVEQVT